VVEYKSRLVGRGFTQVKGQDYDETYSSISKLVTIRLLLALAAQHDWEVHVCDVRNAFLNAPLKEEIYVQLPKGLGEPGKVYRLKKALYGLKQAPRAWNEELGRHLKAHGFSRSASDDALFLKFKEDGGFVFMPSWVDDLMIVSDSLAGVQETKDVLGQGFKLKDLGEVSSYLGMEVTRDRAAGWLEISLSKYCTDLAVRFQDLLEGTSRAATPFAPDVLQKLRMGGWSKEEAQKVSPKLYQSVVGSLMYAATAARPDLSFTVSTLAQGSSDPRAIHMAAAVRALRYLVDTKDFVLRYHKDGEDEVVGFSDSDWASEPDEQSRSAFVFKVAGGAVSWATKKLESISDSTAVSEYKALSLAAKEAIWMRQLLGELSVSAAPITLCCDNESSIKLAKNPVLHQRTKHVKVAWHVVRQAIAEGDVLVKFVPSVLQDADVLTKALDATKHKANRERLGLVPGRIKN
jgi:hypothetical protein